MAQLPPELVFRIFEASIETAAQETTSLTTLFTIASLSRALLEFTLTRLPLLLHAHSSPAFSQHNVECAGLQRYRRKIPRHRSKIVGWRLCPSCSERNRWRGNRTKGMSMVILGALGLTTKEKELRRALWRLRLCEKHVSLRKRHDQEFRQYLVYD